MSFFSFLNTAPEIISGKVRKLEKEGKMKSVIEAIDAERKNRNQHGVNSGTSTDGKVTVKRVGGYNK